MSAKCVGDNIDSEDVNNWSDGEINNIVQTQEENERELLNDKPCARMVNASNVVEIKRHATTRSIFDSMENNSDDNVEICDDDSSCSNNDNDHDSKFTHRRRCERNTDNSNEGIQPGAFSVFLRASGERPAWDGDEWQGEEYAENSDNNSAVGSTNHSMRPPIISDIESDNNRTYHQDTLIEAKAVVEITSVKATPYPWYRRNQWWLASITVIIVILIILVSVLPFISLQTTSAEMSPTIAPTTLDYKIQEYVRNTIIMEMGFSSENIGALSEEGNKAQDRAFRWVSNMKLNDELELYTDKRILQQYSLLAFYFSTSSGEELNSTVSWNRDDEWMKSPNECEWFGVICDKNGSIGGLELNDNNLQGTLPPEIGILSSSLSQLLLRNNNISGSIPRNIGDLSQLTELDLSSNDLSGDLPDSIFEVINLSILDLSNNALHSTIPGEIGSLSMLQLLNLGNNIFIGSIPSEIAYLSKIIELNYNTNRLSHALPTEIGKLKSLQKLHLQNNDLLGPIPSEVGLMQDLRIFDMSKNNVFDKIPVDLYRNGGLKNLEYLDLSHNLLRGALSDGMQAVDDFGKSWQKLTSLRLSGNFLELGLPSNDGSFYTLPSLKEVDLSDNYLTATVPSAISNLSSIEKLNLSNNKLEGTIPSQLFALEKLVSLDMGENNFDGTLSSDILNLADLKLLKITGATHGRKVGITGTIPSELGLLTKLTQLELFDNPFLTGGIPMELGQLSALEVLDLHSNGLSGTIPSSIIKELTNLKHMSLGWNKLIESIPTQFGELNSLTYLDLRHNSLKGTLPIELTRLENLEGLFLEENVLTGSISNEIRNLINLSLLRMGRNKLTGTIPTEIGLLTGLSMISLYSNKLEGSIPSEMGDLTHLQYFTIVNNVGITGLIPFEISNWQKMTNLGLIQTDLTGSIPSTLCRADIRIDCKKVVCTCQQCNCDKETESPTMSPIFYPTQLPTITEPPSSFPSSSPTSSCSAFESISTSGTLFEISGFQSELSLPFTMNWADKSTYNNVLINTFSGFSVVPENDTEDCIYGFIPVALVNEAGLTAFVGSIYTATAEDNIFIISWESVSVVGSSSHVLNFQVALFADSGHVEIRWGQGSYPKTSKLTAGMSDNCQNKRVNADGSPFLGGFAADWPTNQCRTFLPDGKGFYTRLI